MQSTYGFWGRRTWGTEVVLALGVIALLSPMIYFLLKGKLIFAVLYGSGLSAMTLVFSVRTAFWVFLISNMFYLPYMIGRAAIHPHDLMFVILVLAYGVHSLLRIQKLAQPVALSVPFIAFIAASALSMLGAYNISYSYLPLIRLILMFGLFWIVSRSGASFSANEFVRGYVYLVSLFSAVHSMLFFFYQGAERIFGVSGIAFETFTMTGLPIAVALAIWETKKQRRRLFAVLSVIIAGGLAATQSRGPALGAGLTILALLVVSYRVAGSRGLVGVRRSCKNILLVGVVGVLGVVLYGAAFSAYIERFTMLFNTTEYSTTKLRLSLWSAAIDAFKTAPVTGIGIGNFKTVDEVLPYLKFDPVRHWINRASAHNVSLQILSETGILGLSCFVVLIGTALKRAYRRLGLEKSADIGAANAALFAMAFTIFTTTFFMRVWTWGQEGYLLAIFFGLISRPLYCEYTKTKSKQVLN